MFDMRSRSTRPLSCTRLFRNATNVGERLGQDENFSWETRTRFSDALFQKTRQSESSRPLSDLSTDLLVMSQNQLGKRATCPFMGNSSHICYAVRMADFNFLAHHHSLLPSLHATKLKSKLNLMPIAFVSEWDGSESNWEGMLYGLGAGCVKRTSIE